MSLILSTEHIRKFVAQFDQKLSFVDEVAVVAAIDPEVMLKRITARAGVELSGKMTRSVQAQPYVICKTSL